MDNFPIWIKTENTGAQYPYYKENKFSFDIEDFISNRERNELNVSTLIEILHTGYAFGDDTLIKDIKRAPWLKKWNEKRGEWESHNIPQHGGVKNDLNPSKKFKSLLYDELLSYVFGHSNVGILLSGGLDSRIIAGILKETQINKDFKGDVTVYNWGMPNSRDVIYAKEIANRYKWNYKFFEINPKTLMDNFYLATKLGGEISPFHLHGMKWVSDDHDSEIIIAGTYGDSLGRALYSGLHYSKLKNLSQGNLNNFSLFKDNVIIKNKSKIEKDYYSYQSQISDNKESFELREVEQNANYLRRMLATAMSVIAINKPIYQMFTSPPVVSYIWSLDKSVRNDNLYKDILKTLPMDIGNIPYAKTGKSFINNEVNEIDTYSPSYHKYGYWLRNDLKEFIDKELDLNLLHELNIFNDLSLKNLYKLWPTIESKRINKLDTLISQLTVLCMVIKKFDIEQKENYQYKLKDNLYAATLPPKLKTYLWLREKLK